MECHEGAKMIKTFRGLLTNGGQDTIPLHTNDGSTGYRIVKFEGFPNLPATVDFESVLQIWKVKQTSVLTSAPVVDFSDNTLVAALFYTGMSGTYNANANMVMFEREIFNQDIYITHTEGVSNFLFNYYIELEQVKLDLSESTVATLKDIRNVTDPVTTV